MDIQMLGALCFGVIIGWYVYYINRYRKADVEFSDLVTVIGIIGGGAVLSLFQPETDLFGAYGVGLFCGFFGYLIVLAFMVRASSNFDVDWFLDGRRKIPKPEADWLIPRDAKTTTAAMAATDEI